MSKCKDCNDTGEIYISCCTQEIINSDYKRCPKCKENLGPEKCNCKNFINKQTKNKQNGN